MDWKSKIKALRALGASNGDIATQCGMSNAWVTGIVSGHIKSISWEAGDKMLKYEKLLERRAAIK